MATESMQTVLAAPKPPPAPSGPKAGDFVLIGPGGAIDPTHWFAVGGAIDTSHFVSGNIPTIDSNTFLLGGAEKIAQSLGDAAIASAQANLSFSQSLDKVAKLLPVFAIILILGLAVGFSKKGI